MKLSSDFFKKNRKKIFDKMENGSALILSSGTNYIESGDEDFDFDVDKCFYYLTGINQSEVNLVLIKKDNKEEEYLFIEKNDPVRVRWVGAKLYPNEAKELSGIEKIRFNNEFMDSLMYLIDHKINNLYLNLERDKAHRYCHNYCYSKEISDKFFNKKVIDAYPIIVDARFVKEKEEIEKIQEAIDLTKVGVEKLMSEARPGIHEYELEAHFDYVLKTSGQIKHSFKTIAASGKNATILHYVDNNSILKDGDLILFDLGNESDFYISDISRTFPVNGKFTERQKEVYEEVLNVNKKCIEFLKPGITRTEYNDYAKKLLASACKRLGLIKEDSELTKYYWHGIGHSIGLDTHDPMSDYGGVIKNGSLFTVEPGLYIEEENIGIRIEDDVVVTDKGTIVLSKDIIKEVKDIEKYMKEHNKYVK